MSSIDNIRIKIDFMDAVQEFAYHTYKKGATVDETDQDTASMLLDYAKEHGWEDAYHNAVYQGKIDAHNDRIANYELTK